MSGYPIPLTPANVNAVTQLATMSILGITPMNPTPDPGIQDPAFESVRVAWQTEGQPAWTVDEDVVTVSAIEVDDNYNRQRDFKYLVGPVEDEGNPTATELTTYIRVWRISWVIYGPNSFDRARQIRSALFTQNGHDLFSASQLYLVTDVTAPRRAPEIYAGNQWWERVDLSAEFNEIVTEAPTVGTVVSTEIILEDADGIQADFTITAEGVTNNG